MHASQDRALAKLATNTSEAMAHVPDYAGAREDGTLGLSMTMAWTAVRSVRASGVHVASPQRNADNKIVDGVVTALVTTASFENDKDATLWHTMVQGLYNRSPTQHVVRPRSASTGWAPPENAWSETWVPEPQLFHETSGVFTQEEPAAPAPPQPPRVEVTNLTEYDRTLNEAISVLVRDELAAIGVVLPREKIPLDDWLKTTTLHPEIEKWLRAIDDTYRAMHDHGFVVADYVAGQANQENLRPGRRDHIIATDPAAASKAKRDEFNGLIHDVRGGDSRNNAEQHPDRNQRYYVERGVHLRRPKPPRPGEEYKGPSAARPLNVIEKSIIEIRETWVTVRKDPKNRIPELLPELLGRGASKVYGGALDLGISIGVLTAKGIVASWKGVSNSIKDIASFRQKKTAARNQLNTIYTQLWRMRSAIAHEEIPDEFPNQEHTLPPSKQLEVIRQMTTFMLERLSDIGPSVVDGQ
jgi:hypothetical protein